MDIVLLLDDTPHMAFTSVSTAPVPPPTGVDETKGSRNTSVHKQTLSWSLARKAFTLICNDKVVEPTNVCSVFSEIPKIPRTKQNTERARERERERG